MARREPTVFFLTIATLLILLHTLPAVSAVARAAPPQTAAARATPPQTATIIQKTCKKTKYYDLCVNSVPAASHVTDTKSLAAVMVGVALSNANATSAFLSSLVTSTAATDPSAARLLKDCADKYVLAGDSLRDSVRDLAAESYDDAYLNILAAQDYANVCRNSFGRSAGPVAYPPELSRREDGLRRLCDVALGIVDILASQ